MGKLSREDLRRSTLRRQFPLVHGTDQAAVIRLFDRLGPIQSQVPRAPFLTIAARLPGTSYDTICELFESQLLLKTSSLRGTVHTSTRHNFGWLDTVATQSREASVRRALKLSHVTPSELNAEVRRFCNDQWRQRSDIVAHVRRWLAERDSAASAAALVGTFSESIVWGNSGLIRRPRDRAWEKRTDVYHRTAASLVAGLDQIGSSGSAATTADALPELIRRQLAAYGPLTRKDLAFFFGVRLTKVDVAVTALGEEVRQLTGPGTEVYLDLAEPPTDGSDDPGVKLLPEFDGLLLGFHGPNRNRFCDASSLPQFWAKVNGLFSPVVMRDGRLVATWRTRTQGKRTDLEVTMLAGDRPMSEEQLAGPVRDLECALALTVTDVRILASP